MSLSLVTAPASEPITLADAKAYAQIETDRDDSIVTQLIEAARQRVEAETHRQIVTATWDYWLDAFPSGDAIEIPLPPLQSITWLKYVDPDGVLQTWTASNYTVDTAPLLGRIIRDYDVKQWPTIRTQKNAVNVRFIAGYGAIAVVPESLKMCLRSLVKVWYDNPNPVATSGAQPKIIPLHVQSMIDMNSVYDDLI